MSAANQIVVPQGWKYGMPIATHYMRLTKQDCRILLRNGALEQVDVLRRLWRLRLATICDSTRISGGRLALHIDGNIRGVMAREMAA